MIFSRNIAYVIVILSLPFQFSFQLNFYTIGAYKIKSNWNFEKLSQFQSNVADKITTYFGAFSAIIWIIVSYKVRKRRLIISIVFDVSSVIWLIYIATSDNNLWLIIILRAINGILLGFFQTVHISYIMYFAEENLYGFFGCLVQVSMFLSLSLLYLMFYAIQWKTVCIILAIQSFLFSGLIWLIPEFWVIPKTSSHTRIYHQPYLRNAIIMVSIMMIQCFSGIGFMIDNCARLLYEIGIDIDSTVQSSFMNLIGCISTLICSFVIDIVGVRFMWVFSAFGLFISLMIYDLTLKVNSPKWLGVLSVFLYFLFYGLGQGPTPWLLCGVLFPESVMIESGGINTFMNRFMDIWFGYLLSAITNSFGEFGSIAMNATISLIGGIAGVFFIPSLKKRHYENTTIF